MSGIPRRLLRLPAPPLPISKPRLRVIVAGARCTAILSGGIHAPHPLPIRHCGMSLHPDCCRNPRYAMYGCPLRDVRHPVTRCQTPRYAMYGCPCAMSAPPLRDVRVPVRDVRHPVTRCTGARARCQTPRYAMHGHPCAMSGPPCESSQQPLTATSSHAAGAVFPNPPPYSAALTNPPL
jgi:hypothetical protein